MKRKLATILLLVALLGLPAWSGNKSGGSTVGTVSLDKPYLSFGSQGVGTVSSVQTLTITNNTSYPFALTSISAETGFTVALTDCGYLQRKQSCTVQVAFVPLHADSYASRLNLGMPNPRLRWWWRSTARGNNHKKLENSVVRLPCRDCGSLWHTS